ncbi:MAG: porin family protein [Gemmatimonadota bacterium]
MRRVYLLSAFLVIGGLTSSPASAQLSVKGGLTFASTSESEFVPDPSTRTGFSAGVSIGIHLGEVIELRPEALYVQKGATLAGDDLFKLEELVVPLLLQVDIPINGFMPYAFAGPQGEFELSCTIVDVDCVDTKSLRWGAVGGVGIRLARFLSIEGRYNWTLQEISDDIRSKPNAISVMAGIHFGAHR